MSGAVDIGDTAASYLGVWSIGVKGEDGRVSMHLLLRTPSTQVLLTPDQADAAAEMLQRFAAKARGEQQAVDAQPEAAELAATPTQGMA